MQFSHSDINSIITAQENGTLIVFVGAGFSKLSETETIKFPIWKELIEELKQELNNINETDYLKIAQLYYLEFGEYKLYEKLRRFIPLHATPSEFHKKLFQLLEPKYIITTNWDNLLEKTILENGLLYDVIRNESDLVKSNLPSKLIKIHGDFETHNIVFKEDDYLNYGINHPLFENFIRNILSTNTILFLGYSYNDINLKQIIKWVEKNSNISPPRFLLLKETTNYEKKYLENHGIRTLEVSNNNNLSYKELYNIFFNSIRNIKDGNIINPKETPINTIIDYFYKKLIILSELNIILPEQITLIFSNCSIEYHKNCFGLHLHSNNATIDYNYNIRELYKKFFSILKDYKKDNIINQLENKINYILSCFLSAGIVFIKNEENIINIDKLYNHDKNIKYLDLENFITFSSNMSELNWAILIYDSLSNDKKINLFDQISLSITNNLTKKQYLSSMLSRFNHTVVAKKLYLDYSLKDHNRKEEFKNSIKHYFTYELINNNYPPLAKKYFQPIIDLLDFKYLYKLHYDSYQDNESLFNQEINKQNGGFSFYSNEHRSNDRLIHLLRFCAGNNIVLDISEEFKKLMYSYVSGKVKTQYIQRTLIFSQFDLFILIKYTDFKDLLELINKNILDYIEEEGEGKGENILSFDKNIIGYLEITFKNLFKLFTKYSNITLSNTTISYYFTNLILILSLIKWNDEDLNNIIEKIKETLITHSINSNYIKAIILFTLIQYKLYKTNNPNFSKIIDAILERFIFGKLTTQYNPPIINQNLNNLCSFYKVNNIKYSNINLINKVIFSLKNDFKENIEIQRELLQTFLLPIYEIADKKIKNKITIYINKLRISNWNNRKTNSLYKEIFQELDFLQYGFKVNNEFINFLKDWLTNTLNLELLNNLEFMKYGGEDLMLEYFNYLIQNRKLSSFEELKQIFERKIIEIKNLK